MKLPHRCLVYFKLQGDFDPEQATAFIGINPSKTLVKGSRDSIKVLPRCSVWEYSSGYIEGELLDLYDISKNVIAILLPYSNAISEIRIRHKLEAVLQIALWISDDEEVSTPAIGFDINVIKFLADVGASIDIDTYHRSE